MAERDRALETLRRVEDRLADSVDRVAVGAILRSSAAPSLAAMNFLRVTEDSPTKKGIAEFADLIRETAHDSGVKAIVLDTHQAFRINAFIEVEDRGGYWDRTPRFLYLARKEALSSETERLTINEFVESRRKFLLSDPDYQVSDLDEEAAIARVISERLNVIRLGVRVEGEIVAAGEAYICGKTAQLESLAVEVAFRGNGYAKAVVAARMQAAAEAGCDFVFAQINGTAEPSVRLHEHLGFERIGARQTFIWSYAD